MLINKYLEKEARYYMPMDCFNPLQIGSCWSIILPSIGKLCQVSRFQSPSNRVMLINTPNVVFPGEGRTRFNPLQIGSCWSITLNTGIEKMIETVSIPFKSGHVDQCRAVSWEGHVRNRFNPLQIGSCWSMKVELLLKEGMARFNPLQIGSCWSIRIKSATPTYQLGLVSIPFKSGHVDQCQCLRDKHDAWMGVSIPFNSGPVDQ